MWTNSRYAKTNVFRKRLNLSREKRKPQLKKFYAGDVGEVTQDNTLEPERQIDDSQHRVLTAEQQYRTSWSSHLFIKTLWRNRTYMQ